MRSIDAKMAEFEASLDRSLFEVRELNRELYRILAKRRARLGEV